MNFVNRLSASLLMTIVILTWMYHTVEGGVPWYVAAGVGMLSGGAWLDWGLKGDWGNDD